MKRDALSVVIALLLTVMVFAGFMNPVFALSDWKDEWNDDEDDTARAMVNGQYNQIGDPYNLQIHRGEITEGNVYRYAFTQFIQRNLYYQIVWTSPMFYLANYTSKQGRYTNASIYFLYTYTDSGYSDTIQQSNIDVQVGPPGVQ